MDSISLNITYSYAASKVRLNWQDVLFGIRHQLLAPGASLDMATEQVTSSDSPTSEVVELAGSSLEEPVQHIVERLAEAEYSVDPEEIRAKWLYLVLSWVFDHRESFGSPFELVEDIYADFGYPEDVANFVGYMPSDAPDLGREGNKNRMLEQWRLYLDNCAAKYGSTTGVR